MGRGVRYWHFVVKFEQTHERAENADVRVRVALAGPSPDGKQLFPRFATLLCSRRSYAASFWLIPARITRSVDTIEQTHGADVGPLPIMTAGPRRLAQSSNPACKETCVLLVARAEL